MQVIFTASHGSARVDDVRNVKPGYGRFLFRYSKATVATEDMLVEAAKRQELRQAQIAAEQADAKKLAAALEKYVLEFTEKANAEGHLFGSVSEAQIAEKLTELSKVEITKEQVRIGGHIKETGEHEVKIHLMDGVNAHVKVVIIAQAE